MVSPHPQGLQQLPIEIILNIAMQLGWEPTDLRSLLGSCKTIKHILKTHEDQISRQLVSHLYSTSMDPIRTSSILAWPVLDPLPISPLELKCALSCYLPLQVRFPLTFPGIAEQEKRNKILCDLSSSQLLDIAIPNLLLSLFETSTCIYASCGLSDINTFKSHGLNMLLKLSDARVAGSMLTKERKISINNERQKIWICEQDSLALASMLALVWVASMMFDYGDKSTWGAGSCKDNSGEPSAENNNLVKRQGIYRELVLVHGPYFLWCSISKLEEETSWIKKMLDEGVEGLKGYGMEDGSVHQSLGALLLRRLARCKDCEGCEECQGWEELFLTIGREIVVCKVHPCITGRTP
ncbi:hypothetical protein ACLOAV_010424 [Pseudogymnoascus australis]